MHGRGQAVGVLGLRVDGPDEPDWLPLINAYARYDSGQLARKAGPKAKAVGRAKAASRAKAARRAKVAGRKPARSLSPRPRKSRRPARRR